MFQIDLMSKVPVYEQIVNQVEKFILLGILKPDDKIPSVRQLSAELSINPNTIQKAFAELDRRGVIYAVNGKGNFVSDRAKKALETSKRLELEKVRQDIHEFALAGVSKEELYSLIDEVYTEMEG